MKEARISRALIAALDCLVSCYTIIMKLIQYVIQALLAIVAFFAIQLYLKITTIDDELNALKIRVAIIETKLAKRKN